MPCIVQLRSNTRYATGSHYVVLMGLHTRGVVLVDVPAPGMIHPSSEFQRDWTGVVIAFPWGEAERRELVRRINGGLFGISAAITASAFGLAVFSAWILARRA